MNLKQILLGTTFALAIGQSFAALAQEVPADSTTPRLTLSIPLDPTAPNPAPPHPELAGVLEDFGGKLGLRAIVGTFMGNMMVDPRTQPFFANVDRERVKRELAEQFCVILGGDCTYSGRDMRTAHAGMKIDRNNFNALVENLQRAMDTHKVPFRSQNKLLAILAPMHREVVTH